MFCDTCSVLFTDLRTSIANGLAFKDAFSDNKHRVKYHKTKESLEQSAEKGCKICLGIQKETKDKDESRFEDHIWIDLKIDSSKNYCSLTLWVAGTYRQFKLQKSNSNSLNSSRNNNHKYKGPSTDSPYTKGLIQFWMKRCRCRNSFTQPGYIPTRVLEVVNSETIRLIDSRVCGPNKLTGSYVTLSHCWGSSPHSATLTRQNIAHFLANGVPITLMPKTFQDAFKFVSRLGPNVKYIWIDSLCIIQGDPEDWSRESVLMAKNYRNAYLNLSATAAHDSSEGLFFNRNPRIIMPDLLELPAPECPKNSDQPNQFQTYTLVDSNFWHEKVFLGPVYCRGWIIQEMLLALRVIHFLDDQIAWECECLQAAESFPRGILFGSSFHGLRSAFSIHRPDITSYLMSVGPSREVQRATTTWNSIVEVYTTTLLTESADKLVALSGIAELTSSMVQSSYIAGFWKSNLVSQLAWCVKSEYGSDHSTISTRPQSYRAPSFSWASVDAQFGVKFPSLGGETEELIEIAATHIQLLQPSPFGQIAEGAYIDVLCRLYPIKIVNKETRDQPAIEWTWIRPKSGYPHLDGQALISSHWDCLANDLEGIMNHDHEGIYLMPVTRRIGRNMEALILRQTMQLGTFSRVGQVEFYAYPDPLWDNELVEGEQRTIRIV